MPVLKTVFIVFEVLLLFNLLIGVHEWGHFLAARWRRLKVESFAIWFGKPIWKKVINGVEYRLGWIPAGGYVALPQMAPMDLIEGKTENQAEQLPPISALDKIIVAVAGPLFSFLLAVAFACVVWLVGKPVNSAETTSTIGWVDSTGPAWAAGLRPGDKILEVDGHPVNTFSPQSQDSVVWRVITSSGTNISVKYERDGQVATAYPVPYKRPTKWYERSALRQILVSPPFDVVFDNIISNSPAAAAGLRPGDQLVAINGRKTHHFMQLIEAKDAFTNASAAPVELTIRRDDKEFVARLSAEKPVSPTNSAPSFGILGFRDNSVTKMDHPTPWSQVTGSVKQIAATVGAVVSSKSDIGVQQLGGAVMIIRVYKGLFEDENGWRLVLWFSVVMNVNLALLNMLPLPVLDGGHITLALVELVRRRPPGGKILQNIQGAFTVLLIGFMLYLAFFDTGDWARSARREKQEPIVFAAKPGVSETR